NLIEICKQPPAIEEDPYEALSKLRKLLEVQDAYRNTLSWTTELARLANHVVFYVPENPYSVDNYGYPYLMVGTELLPEMGNARRMRIAECIEEVTDHGAGLVIDPHRGDDGAGSVIFPFGHTWAVREFGRFPEPGMFTASAQNVEPRYEFEEVNSQLLPPFARRAFKNFLEQAYGFQNSQVCIQRNVHDKEDVVFVFNLLDFSPEQAKLESIMSGLFWFCRHGRSLGACKTDRESKEWLKPL
ncbi:MAG: hypothetical protein KDD70_05935, partial [Bdellovibrionales bacterium]|nr:hypothetical protein [Bdellovibrionales bacterium]